MNQRRILVDLAHISRPGFWDALEVHDRSQPAVVTHTGVCGVTPHWRNLDDAQIKVIAGTGGVVGVIFHSAFLGDPFWGGRASSIVDHMEQIIAVAGDDFVALGSDWDGMICTPRDMPTVLELPVLVERMLARGWNAERIRKILGGNYLRVMQAIRPGIQMG
jgi:membrane dipeptidase